MLYFSIFKTDLFIIKSLLLIMTSFFTLLNLLNCDLKISKELIHCILKPFVRVLLMKIYNLDVKGSDNIPSKGPAILAGNHTGLLDAFIVSVASKRPVKFIMTNEIFSWPLVGKLVGFFDVIPVLPGNGLDAINKAVEQLNHGKIVCIFPEGKCTEDDTINRFRKGVAKIHKMSNVDIIPFAIEGGFQAWAIGKFPRRSNIKIQFSNPISLVDYNDNDLLNELRIKIIQLKESLENYTLLRSHDNLYSFTKSIVEKYSKKACFSNSKDILTYQEAFKRFLALAQFINSTLKKESGKVAILSESRHEWFVSLLGSILSGMVVIPLDIKLTPYEMQNILNDCYPDLIIYSDKFTTIAQSLIKDVSSIQFIIDIKQVNTIKADHSKDIKNITDLNKTAMIIYTSGTTGEPKGVEITYKNLLSQVDQIKNHFNIKPGENFLSILPLNHLFELTCGHIAPLTFGANIHYANTINSKKILLELKENNIHYILAVPQVLKVIKIKIENNINQKGIVMSNLFKALKLISNRIPSNTLKKVIFLPIHIQIGLGFKAIICGGAPLDKEIEEFFNVIGINIFQGYGLTETSPVISINSPKHKKIGSVGKPLSNVYIKFTEENELLVKGKSIMKGYYNNKKITQEVKDQSGWFHTGDIAHLDKQGYLFITGRKKNLIVLKSGKKVHPEEVESVLIKSDLFKEVCIMGILSKNDNKASEIICAVIVVDQPAITDKIQTDVQKEISLYTQYLAKYKHPTKIIVLNKDLPKTTTRKIKRQLVKKMAENYLNLKTVA